MLNTSCHFPRTVKDLCQTRNECWAKDLHATESTIRKLVAKDIVHRALLESATGKAPFPPARVLRPGATFKTATPQDFQDLTQLVVILFYQSF